MCVVQLWLSRVGTGLFGLAWILCLLAFVIRYWRQGLGCLAVFFAGQTAMFSVAMVSPAVVRSTSVSPLLFVLPVEVLISDGQRDEAYLGVGHGIAAQVSTALLRIAYRCFAGTFTLSDLRLVTLEDVLVSLSISAGSALSSVFTVVDVPPEALVATFVRISPCATTRHRDSDWRLAGPCDRPTGDRAAAAGAGRVLDACPRHPHAQSAAAVASAVQHHPCAITPPSPR
jgi:hypothetical protein